VVGWQREHRGGRFGVCSRGRGLFGVVVSEGNWVIVGMEGEVDERRDRID
jgi:hypothetical protein